MKLTTVLIFSVFALGSASTLADHRHDRVYSYPGHGHHKKTGHYDDVARPHSRETRRHKRAVSRKYREHSPGGAYARVIDVEPVYRYYRAPASDHSCVRYEPARTDYNSHTATVLGAVIGGALGHRIGDAHGDAEVAAVAGGLLGASMGRDLGRRASYNRDLRVEGPCRVRHGEETRRQLVEYKVSYRYNGSVHVARMDYDPGEWVKLDVSFTPA